jgi:predicted nucleotidyltransferase
MNSVIEDNLEKIKEIFKAHRVQTAELFGSALRSDYNENSDVDLLVTFSDDIDLLDYSDNYFELKIELEDLLDRNVDIISAKALKNPVLINEINNSKRELYAA